MDQKQALEALKEKLSKEFADAATDAEANNDIVEIEDPALQIYRLLVEGYNEREIRCKLAHLSSEEAKKAWGEAMNIVRANVPRKEDARAIAVTRFNHLFRLAIKDGDYYRALCIQEAMVRVQGLQD